MSTPPSGPNASDSKDFALLEYQISADTHFRGVELTMNYVKIFMTLNAFSAATLSYLFSNIRTDPVFPSLATSISIICISSAILFCAGGVFSSRQLDNCQERCKTIEDKFQGELFKKISSTKYPILGNATNINFGALSIIFILFWLFILIEAWKL